MISYLSQIGILAEDSPERVIQKRFLVFQAVLMSFGGLLWGSISLYFDLVLPSVIPFGYTVVTIFNLAFFKFTNHFGIARNFQLLISLLLPMIFQFMLGGYMNSGVVTLWSLLALLSSIAVQPPRYTLIWAGLFAIGIAALVVWDDATMRTFEAPAQVRNVLAGINVGVISLVTTGLMAYFVLSRDKANNALRAAKSEIDTIFHNVNEGLFLVNPDHSLSNECSKSTYAIFDVKTLSGLTFESLLQNRISSDLLQTAKGFVDILFTKSLPDKKIAMLNPLSEVQLKFNEDVDKDLEFNFRLLKDEDKVAAVMVIVSDVTAARELERKIQEAEKAKQKQTDLVYSVLAVDSVVLQDYIETCELEISELEYFLEVNQDVTDKTVVLEALYRCIHTIKGNSALLQLDTIVSFCHNYESKIEEASKKEVTGLDLVPLVSDLYELKTKFADLKSVQEKIIRFASERSDQEVVFTQYMNKLAQGIASKLGKSVEFHLDNKLDDPQMLDSELRSMIVQFVRNAVVHGIETSEDREKAGKDATGQIHVSLINENGSLVAQIKDDGRGIDVAKVKSKALAGGFDETKLTQMADKEVATLIFQQGFSTSESANKNAGRGVGLDLVKNKVKKRNGTIGLSYKDNLGTTFVIRLPNTT